MLKKVVVATLFIGLVALLVVGAVNRTLARSELVGGESGNRTGSGQVANGKASGGRTSSAPIIASGQIGRSQVGGQTGGGRGSESTSATVLAWETVTGKVTQIDAEALLLSLDTGGEVLVEGQPWNYAQTQGFAAEIGDTVTVTGYVEADEFKTGTLTNMATAMSAQLRDEFGRPGWSGQGRR